MARIAGVNIPTGKRVVIALTYIHGIGRTKAAEICEKVGIPAERRVNDLTEVELTGIRDSIDKDYQDMIVGRGSITVDGISLTIAEDLTDAFRVAIIPYTWENTNLSIKKEGDNVNLEFDVIGKYVVKYLAKMNKM